MTHCSKVIAIAQAFNQLFFNSFYFIKSLYFVYKFVIMDSALEHRGDKHGETLRFVFFNGDF